LPSSPSYCPHGLAQLIKITLSEGLVIESLLHPCERLLAADTKLPAILKREAEPADVDEQIWLAILCKNYKKLYAAAASFYAGAFAADPKRADELPPQHRYNAACAAALAGCGQGEDARALPDKVSFRLRRQALDWLKGDLAVYAQLAERNEPATKQEVRQRLEPWQQDADLISVRDQDSLAKLPEAEREAWRQLWDHVSTLLAKVHGGP
jgi:hypothetical protein